MIEINSEDREQAGSLAQEVVETLNAAGIEGDDRTALVPMIWSELRNAHAFNKQQRVQQEMMSKAKAEGLGNQYNAVAPMGYGGVAKL